MSAELVQRYFDAANEKDWAAMAELWHDDAELHAVGSRPRIGREDILKYYPLVLSGYSENSDVATRFIESGDTVVVEIAFDGRLHDGRTVKFNALDVFDFVDGRIKNLSIWYDTKSVMAQFAPETTN